MKNTLIITFLFFLSTIGAALPAISQPLDNSVPRDGVKVLGRATQDSIMLRWAPTSAAAWHYGNRYGYVVERVTILRGGRVLEKPEVRLLSREPLKPLPMDKWEIVADTSDYGAVMAQALYGETFEISGGQSTGMVGIYNRSREQESRFSFSLFAADQAYWLAKIAGLGYTDKEVKPNEKYLYRVYIPSEPHILKADTGFAYMGVMDYKELPQPIDVNARFEDRYVMLSWNSEAFTGTYSSYLIERSEDGKNFKTLSAIPHVNTHEGETPKTPFSFRSDSLPENNKEYYYRIRGKNAFGETGPPSEVVSGMGRKQLAASPAITKAESPDNQVMHIEWSFLPELNEDITGFVLMRSRLDAGPYEEIVTDIAPTERWTADTEAMTDNYYKIKVLGKHGEVSLSFSYYAQLVDSIPPVVPTGFAGEIDTTGIVTLKWDRNPDSDLLGYRVFRSNFIEDEFVQLTEGPVLTEQFIDSIPLNSLTEKIYYKVAAVDQRYNISDASVALELKKPDKVPPVAPVLRNPEASAAGITISWIPSSSTDVEKHVLYRSEGSNANEWTVLSVIPLSDTTYAYSDNAPLPGKKYFYTIVAVDDDGLESEPAKPVVAQKTDWKTRPAIQKISADVDRDLKQITLLWNYEQTGVERYVIYRAVGADPIRIYTSVPADGNMFTDKKLTPNTQYTYMVKAAFADGAESEFSKEVRVRY